MFPYKTSFKFDKSCNQPIYLQLANQLIAFIKSGVLPANTKLLGTRTLAELLKVHRKTIVACYEELDLQGWVESIPKKGTFVKADLPLLQLRVFDKTTSNNKNTVSGFSFYKNELLSVKTNQKEKEKIYLNDGVSDSRLTPTVELARVYRKIAGKKDVFEHLSYGSTYGNDRLREVLVTYLNETRGLQITKNNILITRGSQMGIWLSTQLLLKKEDVIVVGATNYSSADTTFLQHEATLVRIRVDNDGLCITELEEICKKKKIKAVYVTSHHHHPTTVTLSAERRIHLLNLAKQHQFAIIEDDYDYDFNYNHAPILPLASHDIHGNVIYIGSICKTVAPVFRIGYLIASKEFVDEASSCRRYIDRQGDALLELTFADFIKSGDLDRHIRKVLKIYKQRRDLFCKLLKEKLSEFLEFDIPKGGMAIWVVLNKKYSWKVVEEKALKYNLIIGDWKRYDLGNNNHNSLRIGFASYNEVEIYDLISCLEKIMKEVKAISLL
ncbi:GntR family transcriptional regulator / MocR family aminotransferase [Tenacibaculum sp. MAR_2010_89]|uniref:MocR-like pyridoxine biosynthesis transcription factor PdxR n=1 Tax=Tenacibaculum sp. MAR_2010_89 TaxID=1250198 RepID=UPI000895720C|nr:PLP-dependent aminotransferase family protein [Tenacibaculum sp. MAR_2010_89]SEE47815.1 GntR family transcriptional regulator / MocR family aminotransferase [Tenacibaculum sp. MAR_2010_89]